VLLSLRLFLYESEIERLGGIGQSIELELRANFFHGDSRFRELATPLLDQLDTAMS
jgi:hypothetical protein